MNRLGQLRESIGCCMGDVMYSVDSWIENGRRNLLRTFTPRTAKGITTSGHDAWFELRR